MRALTGINIQYPISQLILNGSKVIETRTYPIPPGYLGQDLVMIETPGPKGNFKARAVAIIRFGSCHKYRTKKAFYADQPRHRVDPDSPWAWQSNKGKWGWKIDMVKTLRKPIEIRKRIGIRYTKDLEISI